MEIPRIHLIEKRWEVSPSVDDPSIKESGFWKFIDEATAKRLVGGKIYFHLKKDEKSHASGRIIGFRHAIGKERENSILFLFREDDPCERVKTETQNWEPVGLEHRDVYPYRQIIL